MRVPINPDDAGKPPQAPVIVQQDESSARTEGGAVAQAATSQPANEPMASGEAPAAPDEEKPPKGTPDGDAWRYSRYTAEKLAKGQTPLPYDSWYEHSRGGRGGGPEHQIIQKRLEDRGLATEVPFGKRYADAAGPGEIHQIGELNRRGDPIKREREAIEDIRNSPSYNGEDIYFWDRDNPGAPPIKNPDQQPNWNGGE